MSIDPNDPRLTAYALGELDEMESAAVAAMIADDADAMRAVEEIRSLGGKLETAFAHEGASGRGVPQS